MIQEVVLPSAITSPCCVCATTGMCPPCKGSGKSGYFLNLPSNSAPACPHCHGSGRCRRCRGAGFVTEAVFNPYIAIRTSRQRPTSISVAAITGATWRYIDIPRSLTKRKTEAQRGWVAWRVQTYFKSSLGKLLLFGDIVGYRWIRSPEVSIQLDVRGRLL